MNGTLGASLGKSLENTVEMSSRSQGETDQTELKHTWEKVAADCTKTITQINHHFLFFPSLFTSPSYIFPVS